LLELRIQPSDHELDGVSDFSNLLVLGGADRLDVPLDLLKEKK
jgi:hypothetical protein